MSWLQLACVCVCARGLAAAIGQFPDFWYLETFNIANDPHQSHAHGAAAGEAGGGALLALDVREWSAREALCLRAATNDEARTFREQVQPTIDALESRGGARGRRPGTPPRPPSADDDARTLRDIRTMVNKFIVSEQGPLGANQQDLRGETDPTLTVYLRGAWGALVLRAGGAGAGAGRAGGREWQFVLRPPSPLPAYLAPARAPAPALGPLPPPVQTEFYHTLLRLLKIFLRFDL